MGICEIALEVQAMTGDGKQQEARGVIEALEFIAFGKQHSGVIPCPQDYEFYIRPFQDAAREGLAASQASQPNVKLASEVINALKDHGFLSGDTEECEEIVWVTLMRQRKEQ